VFVLCSFHTPRRTWFATARGSGLVDCYCEDCVELRDFAVRRIDGLCCCCKRAEGAGGCFGSWVEPRGLVEEVGGATSSYIHHAQPAFPLLRLCTY
jgi:hypothetical protein